MARLAEPWRMGALVVAASVLAPPAMARSDPAVADPAVADRAAGDPLCEVEIARMERAYQIPANYLMALGRVEAGRVLPAAGVPLARREAPRPGSPAGLRAGSPPQLRIWPWAVNADGTAHFFDSRDAAVAGVRQLRRDGARSIDVGCLQINLPSHPEAFRSLDEAFDPAANVEYGAFFLLSLHARTGSWTQAIARYHSPRYERQAGYVCSVHARWTELQAGRWEADPAGFCKPPPGIRQAGAAGGTASVMGRDPDAVRRARAAAVALDGLQILARGTWLTPGSLVSDRPGVRTPDRPDGRWPDRLEGRTPDPLAARPSGRAVDGHRAAVEILPLDGAGRAPPPSPSPKGPTP